MTMGKRAGGTLIGTLAMTAALVALSTGPAWAATTLTITVKGGGTFTATASLTTLTDVTKIGKINVTCKTVGKVPASSATATVKTGTYKGTAPVKVGTTTKLAFNNCAGPLGPVTTKVLAEPYITSIDSVTNKAGQTDGIISGIKTQVSTTGCKFMVTGSAPGYFTNSKHTLTMTPTPVVKPLVKAQLTISGVAKNTCGGLILNGQHPTFTSVFTLNTKGTITSK